MLNIVDMDSYEIFCKDIDNATNLTELRSVIKYSAFKHNTRLISRLNNIIETYEGKHRQVGRKFMILKDRIKTTLKKSLQ